ncbi:hypothetical protein ACER0C_009012 [Sarotherodon galilaeus]
MAGVAETCTHVDALLFKVEATVRIRGTRTVTEEPAYWVLPGNTTKIQPKVGHNIDFTSSTAQKNSLDENINRPFVVKGKRSRPPKRQIPTATLEELSPLCDTLQEHSKAVCLSGMEKYYTAYTVQSPTLPQSLVCLHNKSTQSLGLSDLQLHCVRYKNAATTSAQEPYWFRWRAGRITASVMHVVFATSLETAAQSVVNRVCYPEKSMCIVQTRWGVEHKEDARKAYTEKIAALHHNLQVRLCGFTVNTRFPELGASPDGLTMCECCGKGVLGDIGCIPPKCPFKYRTDSIKKALDVQDKDICLELAANGLHLKRTHPYYSQVQTQIFVTSAKHCGLIVWTQRDMAVVSIFPDVDFWEPRLKKAQEFFKKVCLPELLRKCFSMCSAALNIS